MNRTAHSDSRRVVVFIALGLVTAVAVGVTVWRVSAPSSVVAGHVEPVAQSSSSATHNSAPSNEYSTSSVAPEPQDEELAAPVATNDPYLAPNAVFDRTQAAGPTAVYRPDNVSAWTQGQDNQGQGHQGQGHQGQGNAVTASAQGTEGAAPSSILPEQPAPGSEEVPALPHEDGMAGNSSVRPRPERPERPDREDEESTHTPIPPNTPQTQPSTPDSPEAPEPSTEQPSDSLTEEPSPSNDNAAGSDTTLAPNADEPTPLD